MIIESIGAKLKTALSSVITLYLAEAQTETYPYAVYIQTVSPIMSKGEAAAYEADCTIRIYDKDFTTADSRLTQVKTAIASAMGGDQYLAILQSEQKDCVEEVWALEVNYRIIQIS